VVVLMVGAYSGVKTIVMAKFDLEKACRAIQDHQITLLYVPPPIVLALAKHPIVDSFDLSSVRFINSGAAPLTKELVDGVWKRLRIGVKQGYGMSEASPTTHSQMIDEFAKFVGSIGRLLPNMEAKIIDEEGKEVPDGEVGSF
jgi:4-coumarate--CoA ligase